MVDRLVGPAPTWRQHDGLEGALRAAISQTTVSHAWLTIKLINHQWLTISIKLAISLNSLTIKSAIAIGLAGPVSGVPSGPTMLPPGWAKRPICHRCPHQVLVGAVAHLVRNQSRRSPWRAPAKKGRRRRTRTVDQMEYNKHQLVLVVPWSLIYFELIRSLVTSNMIEWWNCQNCVDIVYNSLLHLLCRYSLLQEWRTIITPTTYTSTNRNNKWQTTAPATTIKMSTTNINYENHNCKHQ